MSQATSSYLLPCSCGERIRVDLRQAGQTIRCTCGASVEVPTIRGLRSLAPAEAIGERARQAPVWNRRKGLLFIGSIITVGALAWSALAYWQTPRFDPELIRIQAKNLSPAQSWQWWMEFQKGMPTRPTVNTFVMMEAINEHHRQMRAGLIIALFGALTAGSSLFVRP